MLKFSELTPEAKNIAVEGFIEDANAFDFGWEGMNAENVAEMLASKSENHRYDSEGIVIGMVRYYGTELAFTEGGEY